VIIWIRSAVTDTTRRGLLTIRYAGIRFMRGRQGAESGAGGREIRGRNAEALGSGAVGLPVPRDRYGPVCGPGSGQARRVL